MEALYFNSNSTKHNTKKIYSKDNTKNDNEEK